MMQNSLATLMTTFQKAKHLAIQKKNNNIKYKNIVNLLKPHKHCSQYKISFNLLPS